MRPEIRQTIPYLAGGIIGAAAPVVALRYLMFPQSSNLLEEAACWGATTLGSLPIMFYGFCTGLSVSIAVGTYRRLPKSVKQYLSNSSDLESKIEEKK